MTRLLAKWLRRLVLVVGVAYPLSLVAAALLLRYVGESWWVTAVGLYLPRAGFALPLPIVALALYALRMRRLLALQALGAGVILFPLMGFVPPRPTFPDARGETMRVLTFNVNSARAGVDAVVEDVDRHAADVVMLEETGHRRDALAEQLRGRYPTVEAFGQFVFASRYPLSPDRGEPAAGSRPDEDDSFFRRYALQTPLGRVVFYEVHLESPRLALYRLRGGHGLKREISSGRLFDGVAAGRLVNDAQLRALQAEAFSEAAALETDPVVIAGDTNLPGLSPILSRYLSRFSDGFTSAGWGFGYTFPADKWRPWMRIDRILAGDRLRFVHFETCERSPSDHLCAVADLQRR